MEQYIPKAATIEKVREIIKYAELYIEYHHEKNDRLRYSFEHQRLVMYELLSFLNTLKVEEFQEKNLYVVIRCEEHSDYVEKAFFSKKKAEEYCKQFESNEDAYGRDITEIKVDCPHLEIKEVDFKKELIEWHKKHFKKDGTFIGMSGFYLTNNSQMDIAKYFFELGLKAKKEE